MKKLVPLFALLLAALALAACGGGDDNGDTSPVGGAVEEAEDKAGEANDEVEDKAGEAKDEAEGAGGSGALAVEADPDGALAYTEDSLTAEAGKVTIDFNNPAPVPHDVRVEDESGKNIGGTEVISGRAEKAQIELKAGEFTFFCSVPGHREAGMEGDLTVE